MNLPNNPSDAFKLRNPHIYQTGGVLPDTKPQSDPFDEFTRKDEGKALMQGRCLVSFTSFRRRLLDSDNPMPKSMLDALIDAGILLTDAQEHVETKVIQVKVSYAWQERTEIEIIPL